VFLQVWGLVENENALQVDDFLHAASHAYDDEIFGTSVILPDFPDFILAMI
jgi:hypothetical protein